MINRARHFLLLSCVGLLAAPPAWAQQSYQPFPGTALPHCMAYCTTYSTYQGSDYQPLHSGPSGTATVIKEYVRDFFTDTKDFYLSDFVTEFVEPALKKKTQQVVSSDQQENNAEGAIADATQANEQATEIGIAQAETALDYAPHPLIGQMATYSRGLALASERMRQSRLVRGDAGTADLLAASGTLTAKGGGAVEDWRLKNLKDLYIDPDQQGGYLRKLVHGDERVNRDLDVARSLVGRNTLDLNFEDTTLSEDEQDFLALKENLASSAAMENSRMRDLATTDAALTDLPELLSLTARRSLIDRTINTIAGMRARGSDVSAPEMQALLRQLGYADDSPEMQDITGQASYEAHMDILTRRVFQNPNMYVNLIANPTALRRILVSQNAVRNMQQYDMYATTTRAEDLTALWAWLETREQFNKAQGALNGVGR
ncbi:MAG: hypothetical protein V4621_02310 [Pseudomonadota bacterium]